MGGPSSSLTRASYAIRLIAKMRFFGGEVTPNPYR